MPPDTPRPTLGANRPSQSTPTFRLYGALLWLLTFCAVYFSLTPAGANSRRAEILPHVPFLILDLLDPPDDPQALTSSWANLLQRADIVLIAAFIVAAAWCLGDLLLRLAGLDCCFRRVERIGLATGLGLAGLSLLTLAFGVAGGLHRGVLGGLIVLVVAADGGSRVIARCRSAPPAATSEAATPPRRGRSSPPSAFEITPQTLLGGALLATGVLFVGIMTLAAMLPPVDFDVREYHLQGPKEHFLAGRIAFLPHNVYTSFPALTEALSLLAMVLRGDWYRGALAGKLVLMSFAPLTALILYGAGRRLFNPAAGLIAAIVYLTTPWIYEISTVGYVEGALTFYLASALLAAIVWADAPAPETATTTPRRRVRRGSLPLLAGMLAGSAMACKYPGALQVVVPIGTALAVAAWRRTPQGATPWSPAVRTLAVFSAGVAGAAGPWLVKNLVETGNPVYPLLYTIFGGHDWDPELNARWRAAHSPPNFYPGDLAAQFANVTIRDRLHSPLLFGLAPPALLWRGRRSPARWLWLYAAFLFTTWWLLTHRIERFWLPLVPIVALLAGAGTTWTSDNRWRVLCGAAFAIAVAYNLVLVAAAAPPGYGVWIPDLSEARARAEQSAPAVRFLNETLPPDAKVLAVGEAQVFDARMPVVYNTVFDRSIFEEWVAAEDGHGLRDPDTIRRTFHDNGITHVLVNWQEIHRYRATYGFTGFVTPQVFAELRRLGILGAPIVPRANPGAFEVYPVL